MMSIADALQQQGMQMIAKNLFRNGLDINFVAKSQCIGLLMATEVTFQTTP